MNVENGFEIQCLPGAGLPGMEIVAGAYPDQDWFFEAIGATTTDSGVRVTPTTALTHGPVWSAVNIISGDVGQLPLHVMRQQGRNRERFPEHPVEHLLNAEPNGTQTPAIWKETMIAWSLLYGNACCIIERNGAGRPVALIPLLPDRTAPKAEVFQSNTGDRFNFMIIESWIDNERVSFLYEDIFHIRGLAHDGFWGLSAAQICKDVIGHGMATERHGNRLFNNSATPSGVLQHPGSLSPDAREQLRKEWYSKHGGLTNAGRTAILMEGMAFNPISMNSRDAQLMEDRKFDREMIASIFQLPAFKLNALENSAVRANLEEQNRDYFNTSLSRHLNKFKEEGERKLLGSTERRMMPRRGKVFLKWFPEAFLRGDTKSRFEAYNQAISGRFMSPNEVREKEDLNPYPGGDEFLNPAIEQANNNDNSDDDEDDEEDDDNTEAKTMARQLMTTQVQALLDTEAAALHKSVGETPPRNFSKWVTNYYEKYPKMAGNFLERPAEVAKDAGFNQCDWKFMAGQHANCMRSRYLEVAENYKDEDFSDVISNFANRTASIHETYTSAILGELP